MWFSMSNGKCYTIGLCVCVCVGVCVCVYNLSLSLYKDDLEVKKTVTLCLITEDTNAYREAIIQLVPR